MKLNLFKCGFAINMNLLSVMISFMIISSTFQIDLKNQKINRIENDSSENLNSANVSNNKGFLVKLTDGKTSQPENQTKKIKALHCQQ